MAADEYHKARESVYLPLLSAWIRVRREARPASCAAAGTAAPRRPAPTAPRPRTACLVEPDGRRILLVDIHRQLALELTGVPHKPPPAASSMILRREESASIFGPESPRNPIGVPSSEQRTQISSSDCAISLTSGRNEVMSSSVKKSCVGADGPQPDVDERIGVGGSRSSDGHARHRSFRRLGRLVA